MATTKYSRLSALFEVSETSDLANAERRSAAHSRSVGTLWQVQRLIATTGGIAVELGLYTTVYDCVVLNLDTTNYVDVTGNYDAGTAFKLRVDAASDANSPGWIKITKPRVNNDLTITANTASCEVEVWLLAA